MTPSDELSLFRRIVRKARTELARRTREVPSDWPPERRVVSFTFDDFPRTAGTNGASILEGYGARGTFYSSFGLAGRDSPSGVISTHEETAALAERGHEIGCHTFSHLDCSTVDVREVGRDCARNRDAAARLGLPGLSSFAFPFGGINDSSRHAIATSYRSARSVWRGVNRGRYDLAALRAFPLTSPTTLRIARRLLEDVEAQGGWVVFVTHDVTHDASAFGCTPGLLTEVCRLALQCGAEVLPVGLVLRGVASEPQVADRTL